jgi:hypothetical protein
MKDEPQLLRFQLIYDVGTLSATFNDHEMALELTRYCDLGIHKMPRETQIEMLRALIVVAQGATRIMAMEKQGLEEEARDET